MRGEARLEMGWLVGGEGVVVVVVGCLVACVDEGVEVGK